MPPLAASRSTGSEPKHIGNVVQPCASWCYVSRLKLSEAGEDADVPGRAAEQSSGVGGLNERRWRIRKLHANTVASDPPYCTRSGAKQNQRE